MAIRTGDFDDGSLRFRGHDHLPVFYPPQRHRNDDADIAVGQDLADFHCRTLGSQRFPVHSPVR